MKSLLARIREPLIAGVVLALALVIVSFVTLGFAWRGVARLLYVPLQLPYAVSGGFFALGLLALGLCVLRVQTDRLHDAHRRRALDAMVRDAAELIPLMRARRRKKA